MDQINQSIAAKEMETPQEQNAFQNDVDIVLNPKYSNFHPDSKQVSAHYISNADAREVVLDAQSYSLQSCQFQYSFSENTLMDRKVFLRVPVTVVVSASAVNRDISAANEQIGLNRFALANSPINRSISNLTVNIDGVIESSENNLWCNAIGNYSNNEQQLRTKTYGSEVDPYANIASYPDGDNPSSPYSPPWVNKYSRRSISNFTRSKVAADAAVVCTITYRFVVVEELQSPLFSNGDDILAKMKRMNVNIKWLNGLETFFLAKNKTITNGAIAAQDIFSDTTAACSIALSYTSTPQLLLRTYTSSISIPPVVKFPYSNYVLNPFVCPSTSVQATNQVNTGVISLSQIPSRIYVFIRPTALVNDQNSPDCMLPISNIVLRVGQRQGLLSSSTPSQLYQMSVRNGYDLSYPEFLGNACCVAIDLNAGDIGGYVPNTLMDFQYNMTVTYLNNTGHLSYTDGVLNYDAAASGTPAHTAFSLYVMNVFDNAVMFDGEKAIVQGGSSVSDVLSSIQKGYSDIQMNKILIGNGFMRSATRFFHKAKNFVNKASHAIAPYAEALGSVDPRLAAVSKGVQIAKDISGGRKMRGGALKLY